MAAEDRDESMNESWHICSLTREDHLHERRQRWDTIERQQVREAGHEHESDENTSFQVRE